MCEGMNKPELSDRLGKPADIATIPVEVLHFIHDRFHQTNAKATFSFFMNKAVNARFMKPVNVEHFAIVENLKNNFALFRNINMQFQGMVGIALMCVNHKVRTHFIHSKNNFIQDHIGCNMAAQRLSDKVADAFKILQAAADAILIVHVIISLLPAYSHVSATSPPAQGFEMY